MTDQISTPQKQRIKEMVDELIVNHGILKTHGDRGGIDGLNVDQLIKMAFKYYRMIISGESPLDIDMASPHRDRRVGAERGDPVEYCIGCNRKLSDNDISEKMPVCGSCRQKVKTDYCILSELFR